MASEPLDLTLRPAGADDVDAVAALHLSARRANPGMPDTVHSDTEVRGWVADRVEGSAVQVWVAEAAGGGLAGYAAYTSTWLDDLYVDPDHQRQGVGSALLELVQARLPGGFSLWVFAANASARAFYQAHGLVELEETDGSANEERAPDVRLAWPGERPLAFLRGQIDEVDDDLAVLLARRAALTAAVQDHKRATAGVAGEAARDADREAEIVARMSHHAPGLPPERLARIVHAVIEESIGGWEDRQRT